MLVQPVAGRVDDMLVERWGVDAAAARDPFGTPSGEGHCFVI